MSSDQATDQPDPSRQTNLNKCGEGRNQPSQPISSDSEDDRELPTPEDVLWTILDESWAWEFADLPVVKDDETPIREDYTRETRESWESDILYHCDQCDSTLQPRNQTPDEHVTSAHGDILSMWSMSPVDAIDAWIRRKSVRGERVREVEAISWIEAVAELLDSHEQTRKTTINLQYGWPRDEDYATYSLSATDRWSPDYQTEFYAECQGWLRELTGGERPSGGETEASFDNPSVAFLTRSASSIPDDERLGPVDHAVNLRDPWREVYQKLRYELEQHGFSNEDYQYWRVLEPHPGTGVNRCYAHEHIIIVVDGEIPQSAFRPVMETHVSATNGAGMDAHTNTPCPEHADGDPWNDACGECEDCETPVSVRDPDTVENLAAYVADYASIDPLDLFERSPEYIMWAAAMTAGNVRSVSRSDPAGWAATADRCKQMHESPRSDLEGTHGDRLTTSNKGTNRLECAECGSPHGIDQDQTLAKNRIEQDSSAEDMVVADGGSTDLWDEWVKAWRAGRSRTAVRQCYHPENSNQCPLCAEYQGAVDASVPIPEDTYLPDDAFENETEKHVEKIEEKRSRNPDVSAAGILGMLFSDLPDDHAEALVNGVLAGFERPDDDDLDLQGVNESERVPEWRVKSVMIDGEEHFASAGNGVVMTTISSDESWRESRSSESGEPWRKNPFYDDDCNECPDGQYEWKEHVTHRGDPGSRYVCDSCGHEEIGGAARPTNNPQQSGSLVYFK